MHIHEGKKLAVRHSCHTLVEHPFISTVPMVLGEVSINTYEK